MFVPPAVVVVVIVVVTSPSGLLADSTTAAAAVVCPSRCVCSASSKTGQPLSPIYPMVERLRVKCGGGSPATAIIDLDELQLAKYSNLTGLVSLDLSENNLTQILSKSFPLVELQKLDLNKNQIELLEDGAFENLISLKRLDLSNNRLRSISRGMFEGLVNLEKLKISSNLIRQIKDGAFDSMASLKQLDVSNNPLLCDCNLWWIATWANNMSIKLSPMPKCWDPLNLRDQPLRKFKAYSQQCAWTDWSVPLLELSPDRDQVVFEGDPLKLHCRAGLYKGELTDSRVNWFWSGLPPESVFHSTIQTENSQTLDSGFLESTLIIDQLRVNHSGEWNCDLTTSEGNHSSSVSVIVLNRETKYCPGTVTKDNKGEYNWPRTVAGHLVELPCAALVGFGLARNNCTASGQWSELDTSVCPFVSETTRILQQYAKMNLSAGRSSVNESAIRLHNYTVENKELLNDVDDVVFIAQTIENYLEFVSHEPKLGTLLLDLISHIIDLDAHLLADAQMKDRSCSKLLAAIETIIQYQLDPYQGSNMLIEKFMVPRETFLGMTCTWWYSLDKRVFHCTTSNATVRIPHDKILEASIHIPSSLFHQLEMRGHPAVSHQIVVSIFYNAKLFPTTFNVNRTVSSPIVGAKLVGLDVRDLMTPANVMLGGLHEGVAPAWWDSSLGDWVTRPCRPSHLVSDLLVTKCNHLGYYALISNIRPSTVVLEKQAKSRLCSYAVFIGTFIGSTCLLVAAFTYAICHAGIQMSDKMKHSLANSWTAIAFLSIIFNVGIYQTEEVVVCQAVGLLLHYLTLCSLFWFAVSINGMHRAVASKMERVVSAASDDGGGDGPEVVGQPLVGLYLVGWGVSALLVGLSGAVNPRGYASPTYCSLGPGPGFTPVLVPVMAVFVFLLTRSLMVRSAAVEKDSNVHLSEDTQATDLELLETAAVPPQCAERVSVHSVATPSSQLEDVEHPPYVQLKAFVIVVGFFIAGWCSAALSVIKPFHLPHEELVFSTIYAILVITLGKFVIFFYCFSRSDVRSVWFTLKHIKRSRNVTDVPPPPIINSNDAVDGRKSNSPRPEPQGNNSLSGVSAKPNFVDLHRRQYQNNTVVNEPDAFYNPHQSIVAKRFFKKQRRKRNNLGRRRGTGDGGTPLSPDTSELFHLGSKVNNTNIHVEPSTPRSTDRNIFGDRRHHHHHNVASRAPLPLERYVIGAESNEPTLNNDGSVKYASVASECSSCLVSEAHSITDCTPTNRDRTTSEHSSRSSHLYATVAPDEDDDDDTSSVTLNVKRPPHGGGRQPHRQMTVMMNNDLLTGVDIKGVKKMTNHGLYDMKTSDEDKKETSV